MRAYAKNTVFAFALWLVLPLVMYFPRFLIEGTLFPALCEWFPSVFENYSPVLNDPKTELQQLIQQAEGDVLEYHVVGESGPDHQKIFEVEARMNSNVIGSGKGKSKREAEQNAAIQALRLFGEIE